MQTKTIHNYAAHAERGLERQADMNDAYGRRNDARAIRIVRSWLPDAVHFSIQDNGLLFDDNLRGLQHTDVRLPHDKITIEYFVTDEYIPTTDAPRYVPHRLIFAERLGKLAMIDKIAALTGAPVSADHLTQIPGDEVIAMYSMDAGADNVWGLYHAAVCVPTAWDNVTNKEWAIDGTFNGYDKAQRRDGLDDRTARNVGLSMSIVPILHDACRYAEHHIGYDKAMSMMAHDLSMELTALYEFCEAMMCCNIDSEIVQYAARAARNDKRRKKGKLPIYETRVLSIVRPGESSDSTHALGHGERSGPRQHLRRGHIRRLPDERRIWVQSCLVGSSDNGVIDKSYGVSAQT